MPRSHSVREAVNEQEVYSALVEATKGYGGLVKFSQKHNLGYEYLQMMLCRSSRVSAATARSLGYELKWVRIEHEKKGTPTE